jgi:hypothetical protein
MEQRFLGFSEFAGELSRRLKVFLAECQYHCKELDIPDADENPAEFEKWLKEQNRRKCTHSGLSHDDLGYNEGAHYGVRTCRELMYDLVNGEIEQYKKVLDKWK